MEEIRINCPEGIDKQVGFCDTEPSIPNSFRRTLKMIEWDCRYGDCIRAAMISLFDYESPIRDDKLDEVKDETTKYS